MLYSIMVSCYAQDESPLLSFENVKSSILISDNLIPCTLLLLN